MRSVDEAIDAATVIEMEKAEKKLLLANG